MDGVIDGFGTGMAVLRESISYLGIETTTRTRL
jgi:hypothetical protein